MNEKEAITDVAHGVVIQAATDWRSLCESEEALVLGGRLDTQTNTYLTFADLRKFFKSTWCGLLCGGVNPQFILEKLEKEREEALNAAGWGEKAEEAI